MRHLHFTLPHLTFLHSHLHLAVPSSFPIYARFYIILLSFPTSHTYLSTSSSSSRCSFFLSYFSKFLYHFTFVSYLTYHLTCVPLHLLTCVFSLPQGREPFIRMKIFLEDDNAVHKLVASQYKIAPEKLMRTGGYTAPPRKYTGRGRGAGHRSSLKPSGPTRHI